MNAPVEKTRREELIGRLEWNNGGMGYGICAVAGMMLNLLDKPGPGHPDLKSIVIVSTPAEKYTDEELERLVQFSDFMTADNDKRWKIRRGANFICISKIENGRWMRKRTSWQFGVMFSETLDEACKVFESRV